MSLTLNAAQSIVEKTLAHGKEAKFKTLGVVVLDIRATVKAAAIGDGSSLARFDIARAKAKGALAFNMARGRWKRSPRIGRIFSQVRWLPLMVALCPCPAAFLSEIRRV